MGQSKTEYVKRMHLSCMWTIVEVIDFRANLEDLVQKGTQKTLALPPAVLHVLKWYQTCEQHQAQISFKWAHARRAMHPRGFTRITFILQTTGIRV